MATRAPLASASLLAPAIAGLLLMLAAYGVWSTVGLAARWGASGLAVPMLLGWLAAAALAVPLRHRRPGRRLLILAAAVGIALRVAAALLVAHRLPVGDAANYLTLAAHFRAGQGLWLYDPWLGSIVRGFYPPFYPILLAGWDAIAGLSVWSLSALSLAIDGAAAIGLVRLAAAMGRPGAGRAAAWLYLIWPATLLSAPLAQKEGLCVLLIVTLANLWLAAARARTTRRVVAIGIVTGLLALTQPGEAPLALLIGLAMIPVAGVRRILRIGIPAAIVAALAVAPWWIRNAIVFHRFVPLTSAGGLSLWVGNNPEATGNWMPPPAAWRGPGEIGYGAHAGAVARAWIAAHPAAFVRLTLTKLVRTLGVAQAGLVRAAAMRPTPAAPILAALMPVGQASWVALLLASGAAIRSTVRTQPLLLALVVACFAQMLGFGIWFEFAERHREFATPFLLLLAVVGLEHVPQHGVPQRSTGLTFRRRSATCAPIEASCSVIG